MHTTRTIKNVMHVCSTSSVILNNEAQLIFRDLHSETVKNDDNSSRYEISSHEPSAYDGAHKEEKEEGERKGKKEDVEEQNVQKNEEEEVFKSMPVTVTVTVLVLVRSKPPYPLPTLLKKKNCSLMSVDSRETFHSPVERQRGVTACLSWALCWTCVLLCLCVCFLQGGVEGSLVMLENTLLSVVKTVPLLVRVPSMQVSVSAPFLHQDNNTIVNYLDHVSAAPCMLLSSPIVMIVPHDEGALLSESIYQRTSNFENMKKKIHGAFFL